MKSQHGNVLLSSSNLLSSSSRIVTVDGSGEDEGTPGGVSNTTSNVSSPSRASGSSVIDTSAQALDLSAGMVMLTELEVKSAPSGER